MTDKTTMTSVERALAVLGAFQLDDTSLSLAELAQRTTFYKSTILRLARSLQNAHFLVRLESGRYQLGAEVVRLGEICKRGTTLDRLIMPVCRSSWRQRARAPRSMCARASTASACAGSIRGAPCATTSARAI